MSIGPRDTRQSDRRVLVNRIDSMCDEFEAAWKAGDRPDIEAYLRRLPKLQQPLLLKELLSLELDLLQAESCEVSAVAYLARFPRADKVIQEVFALSTADSPALSLVSLANVLSREQPVPLSAPFAELQKLASERQFACGEFLIRQGEEAGSLMVIREGQVEITVEDHLASTHVIGRVGPGQVLGEMALLTNEPRTANAVAVGPVRAAILSAESFHELAGRDPEVSPLLTDIIAARLGESQRDALTDKQLDRYCIHCRLGRGGMSIVYEAQDTVSNERVALKMMSHRLVCSPAALRRFQLEADLIERFDHPNIVRMLSRFAAFRTYFIVMEYCAGETLATHLSRSGPLDEACFRACLGQLAMAVQYAHGEGVVHRDIKPANIMHRQDGTLKLMDFGLAEPIVKEANRQGELVGTPRYMAPEQRAGSAIDHRSDYFSMGCVAYEMLTSCPLFTRSTLDELSRDFSNWQPPDFTRLGVTLSESTSRMAQSLLAPDPEKRTVDLRCIAEWAE